MADVWPDEVDLEVTGIAQGGDGVGRWQGRTVFASGALPGEYVRVRLRDRQRSFARGQTTAVLVPAPERINSPCPLEDRCGAADWRWIDYAAQLRFKAAILQDQLRHIGGVEREVSAVHGMAAPALPLRPACAAGPGWGYRTTVELHAAGDKLGYFAPDSRRVVDLPQCCLHHASIDRALVSLRALLDNNLWLRNVTLRCAPASGAVLAVVEAGAPLDRFAQQWMAACPELQGMVQRHRSGFKLVQGQDYLIQELNGIRWHVGAGSFFQVNAEQTALLIERVANLLQVAQGQRILDLFCGVGTFALPLAEAGARVTGVEVYAPAVEDARRSAELNNLQGLEWHAGPVEAVLARLAGPYDGAVLDPPRRGCDLAALQHLLRLRPERIVYVACHPGTLARDCKVLSEGGYTVERVEMIDLFPQTHHVESIVLLHRIQ